VNSTVSKEKYETEFCKNEELKNLRKSVIIVDRAWNGCPNSIFLFKVSQSKNSTGKNT